MSMVDKAGAAVVDGGSRAMEIDVWHGHAYCPLAPDRVNRCFSLYRVMGRIMCSGFLREQCSFFFCWRRNCAGNKVN